MLFSPRGHRCSRHFQRQGAQSVSPGNGAPAPDSKGVFVVVGGVFRISKLSVGAAPVLDGRVETWRPLYGGTGVELRTLILNSGLVTQVACL
jgi:hypothetical protein